MPRDDEIENRHREIVRDSQDYDDYLRRQEKWHRQKVKDEKRNRSMARSTEKFQRQAASHAPKQMQESGGFLSKFRNRNSPENRKKRISNLKLEAEEEHYKSQIHIEKQKRGGGTWGKVFQGDTNVRVSGRSSRKSSRSNYHVPPAYSGLSQGDMGGFEGMNSLFGVGESKPSRSRKQTKQRDGLFDLFG